MLDVWHNAYEAPEDFPPQVVMSRRSRAAFAGGPASFFGGLAQDFAQLHEVLVDRCSALQLLEFIHEVPDRPPQHLFSIGASVPGGLLRAGVNRFDPDSKLFRLTAAPKLMMLPASFHGFYDTTDGMGFLHPGELTPRDLPSPMSGGWTKLHTLLPKLRPDVVIPVHADRALAHRLGLWAVMKTRHNHLVLVDAETQELFVSFAPTFDRIYALHEPEYALDPIFADVVLGNDTSLLALWDAGAVHEDESYPLASALV